MSKKLIAKKHLGQNFLRSEKALNDIASTLLNLDKKTIIIEIGGGEGVLTKKILDLGFSVKVIELDIDAVEKIQSDFKEFIEKRVLEVFHKDVLKTDFLEIAKNKDYAVVGNIPYYITGLIFRHIFGQEKLCQQATLLVQKEVAQRITDKKKESILSLSLKFYGDVKMINIVKSGSFVPAPKVDSAIILINNIIKKDKDFKEKEKNFFKLIHAGFAHPRKYTLSNIKKYLGEESVFYKKSKENILEKQRSENVPISVWLKSF